MVMIWFDMPRWWRHSWWCSCNAKGNEKDFYKIDIVKFSAHYDEDLKPGSDEDAAEDEKSGGPFVEELEAPVVDGDGVDLKEAAGDLCHRSH